VAGPLRDLARSPATCCLRPATCSPAQTLQTALPGEATMWLIIAILLILWLLGLITKYTLGGFLHILLIVAIILLIIRLVTGRRVV
jgi:hypothetical protein